MTMTQFAMFLKLETAATVIVEELASLIKDNLSCKHLVLSVEEALVNFLQDDTSLEGVLELQPMSPYHRLLLHRLSDIYGFAHESVGEGDDRHLILERCPETAIPSILVSDIVWQHDGYESPSPSRHILRRKEVPDFTELKRTLPSSTSLEEREAAYLAARERIFSVHESDEKEATPPKSRKVPVVAQRMIAHALGARIISNAPDPTVLMVNNKKSDWCMKQTVSKKSYDKPAGKCSRTNDFVLERKGNSRASGLSSTKGNSVQKESNEKMMDVGNLEREQVGAAKRIFAHAMGLAFVNKVNWRSPVKFNQGSKAITGHTYEHQRN